jgi:hypothetical protein
VGYISCGRAIAVEVSDEGRKTQCRQPARALDRMVSNAAGIGEQHNSGTLPADAIIVNQQS